MERPLTQHIRTSEEPLALPAYTREGGYEAVRQALTQMSPEAVTEAVKAANLRGRGGAGFPTGVKWSFVPMDETAPRPKYLIANADEMEPGTFKDRLLLEGNPHQLIEGMIVSAYAIQADVAWANGFLGSPEVRIGILDTGIDYTHLDLAGRVDMAASRSFVPSDAALVQQFFPAGRTGSTSTSTAPTSPPR